MKKSLLSLFIITVFLFPFQGTNAKENSEQKHPLLFIEKTMVNAGTVVEGEQLTHTFLVQNRGDAPLVIEKAETDCSCTRVIFDQRVEPKHVSRVRVIFNTFGESGAQVKTVQLHSNDPLQPVLTLTIKAKMLKAVNVEPDRVFFNGPVGKEINRILTVKAPGDNPFKLTLSKAKLPDQVGFYIEKPETGNAYKIYVRYKGEQAGTSRGRIFLSTDIPRRPQIVIPVYSRIHDVVELIPNQIDFGRLKLARYKGKKPLSDPVKALNINSQKGMPKIKSITLADPDRFSTNVICLDAMGVVRIEISAKAAKFEKGKADSKLDIMLEQPETRTLSVPLHLEVR